MYQQFQKHSNSSWHNQFPRYNNAYYNRKTNEELEELIKVQIKQHALLLQIEDLNNELENQKNEIYASTSSDKQRNQISLLFEELFAQQKKYVIEKLDQQEKVRKYEQYIKHKRAQVDHISTQIKKYEGMVVDLASFDKELQIQAALKQKEEHLENEILGTDPFSFEEDQKNYLNTLFKQLEECKQKEKNLIDELAVKQLQETIEKNTLVVEIGKFEQLEREHKQKQGKLKSLERHLQQIKQRISAMLKQKKLLKKRGKEISVQKEMKEVEAQKKELEEQLSRVSIQIARMQKNIENGYSRQKLEQLDAEIKRLEQKEQQRYREAKKIPNKQQQVEALQEEYETNKKYRRKKLQKSQKRLKAIEVQIEENKREVLQLRKSKEQQCAELSALERQLAKINEQMQQIKAQLSSRQLIKEEETVAVDLVSNVDEGNRCGPDKVQVQSPKEQKQVESIRLYAVGAILIALLMAVLFFI